MKFALLIIGFIVIVITVFAVHIKNKINQDFIKGQENIRQNPSPREYPDSMKIEEDIFWSIIETSGNETKNINEQIKYLTIKLSKRDNTFIRKFECTFREVLMRSYHFNVMGAQKLIDNFVSDDTFLYFRCAAILQGKIPYYTLINSTDNYGQFLSDDYWGEGLLFSADEAYRLRNSMVKDEELPSFYGLTVDYDFGRHVVLGENWSNKKELKNRFPSLYSDIKRNK